MPDAIRYIGYTLDDNGNVTDDQVEIFMPVVQGSNGDNAVNVVAEITSALAESWKFQDGNTIVNGGAAYTTADVSLFLPFDNLKIAEDGAASVTWSVQLRPGSKGVLIVSGAGSINVVGVINAVDTAPITVSTTAGVSQVAATLAAGTYFIEV